MARQTLVRAYDNLHVIEKDEEENGLKEEVHRLRGANQFLELEKNKLTKEEAAVVAMVTNLRLKVKGLEKDLKELPGLKAEAKVVRIPALETQADGVPELESEVDKLQAEVDRLKLVEDEASQHWTRIQELGEQLGGMGRRSFKPSRSPEFKLMSEPADAIWFSFMRHKVDEWATTGWLDKVRMRKEIVEKKKSEKEEAATRETEASKVKENPEGRPGAKFGLPESPPACM